MEKIFSRDNWFENANIDNEQIPTKPVRIPKRMLENTFNVVLKLIYQSASLASHLEYHVMHE